MKKFLLTATMLVSFAALSQAQQGRVGINTTAPAATLDVVATPADTARPDALLVPRMTRAELAAKNAAYVAAQNGALTFVTTLDGAAAGKTVNVIATGFYYYDAPNSVWKGIGGSTPAPVTNITTEQTGNYTASATDDIILLNPSSTTTLTLPTTGIVVGKRYYVSNKATTNNVNLSPLPREGSNQSIPASQGAILIYLGGSGDGSWSLISGY